MKGELNADLEQPSKFVISEGDSTEEVNRFKQKT